MAAKKTLKPKHKASKGTAKAAPSKRAAKATRSPATARPKAKNKAPARPKASPKKAAPRKAAKPKQRPVPKKPALKKVAPKKPLKKPVKKVAPKRPVKKAAPKKPVKKVAPKKPAKKAAPKRPVKKAAPKKAFKPLPKAIAKKPIEKALKKPLPKAVAKKPIEKALKKPIEKLVPSKKAPTPPRSEAKKAPKAPPSRAHASPPAPEPRKSGTGKVAPPAKSSAGKVAPPSKKRSEPPPEPSSKKRGSTPPASAAGSGKKRSALPVREPAPRIVTLPLPMMAPPKRPSIEERAGTIEKRLGAQSDDFRKRYVDSFDMSWIYHDSALEGVVYTFEELRTALSGQAQPVTDSSLQPTYDDIRRHKEAIDFVRDFGEKKRLPVTVDVMKKIYLILHPEEGDIKTVKYRKDIPQHRLYFHEYAPPDKIAYKVRQIVDWLNDPETKKTRNSVRISARAHYDLLRVYPFPTDSGKVARLFMNLLLMRSGLPPAILHSTERQRYYEALKGSATTVLQMVQEAVENALSSVEKLLDEHETRKRAFVS